MCAFWYSLTILKNSYLNSSYQKSSTLFEYENSIGGMCIDIMYFFLLWANASSFSSQAICALAVARSSVFLTLKYIEFNTNMLKSFAM